MSNTDNTKPENLNINNLINALNKNDQEILLSSAQSMRVEAGHVLFEPGDDVQHTFFPCGPTLVSFLVELPDGRAADTALIGREGAVGGIVSDGNLPAFCRAVVQAQGPILKISVQDMERAKNASPHCRRMFARYADCLLAQIFQSVACNALHSIEERIAKTILLIIDHTQDEVVRLSQEQLAAMVGVGRSYTARVIGSMRELGVVNTTRGRLHILERKKLEAIACDCEKQVVQHFRTVLHGIYPHEGVSQVSCS